MSADKILIASDHAGFSLKQRLGSWLAEEGYDVVDLGAHDETSVDYPDFGHAMAAALGEGRAARGVLVCGSGIGISIAANRHKHVRCVSCQTPTDARLSRQHNDANVIAFGARISGEETVLDCLRTFLATEFEGGRHVRRVEKL